MDTLTVYIGEFKRNGGAFCDTCKNSEVRFRVSVEDSDEQLIDKVDICDASICKRYATTAMQAVATA